MFSSSSINTAQKTALFLNQHDYMHNHNSITMNTQIMVIFQIRCSNCMIQCLHEEQRDLHDFFVKELEVPYRLMENKGLSFAGC